MNAGRMKTQQAIEFITVYAWALIGLTLFIAIVIAISGSQSSNAYPSARCYIEPSFPCYNMYVMPNSAIGGSIITLIFSDDLDNDLYFPVNAFSIRLPSGNFTGTCYPEGPNSGIGIYCYAVAYGYSPSAGTQLNPTFYISYSVCSNEDYYQFQTFEYETCQGKVGALLPIYNTSGSAELQVSPYFQKIWTPSSSQYFIVWDYVVEMNNILGSLSNTINLGGASSIYSFTTAANNKYVYFPSALGLDILNTATSTIANVPAGSFSEAVSSNGTFVYTVGGNKVYAVDSATAAIVNTISIANSLWIGVSPNNAYVYVASSPAQHQGLVSIINTTTYNVVNTISINGVPGGAVDFSLNGKYAYIDSQPLFGPGLVYIINTATHASNTVNVGNGPQDMAISPNDADLYVVDTSSEAVSVVNTTTYAVNTITVGGGTNLLYPIAITPNGSRAYVESSQALYSVNITTGAVSTVLTGSSLQALETSANGKYIYGTDFYPPKIYVINIQNGTVSTAIP